MIKYYLQHYRRVLETTRQQDIHLSRLIWHYSLFFLNRDVTTHLEIMTLRYFMIILTLNLFLVFAKYSSFESFLCEAEEFLLIKKIF